MRAPGDRDQVLRLIATSDSDWSRPPVPGIATSLWKEVTGVVGWSANRH